MFSFQNLDEPADVTIIEIGPDVYIDGTRPTNTFVFDIYPPCDRKQNQSFGG
jgi:hypothetical protein